MVGPLPPQPGEPGRGVVAARLLGHRDRRRRRGWRRRRGRPVDRVATGIVVGDPDGDRLGAVVADVDFQSLATVWTSTPGTATHWSRCPLTNWTAAPLPLVSTVATQRTWLPFCSAWTSRMWLGAQRPVGLDLLVLATGSSGRTRCTRAARRCGGGRCRRPTTRWSWAPVASYSRTTAPSTSRATVDSVPRDCGTVKVTRASASVPVGATVQAPQTSGLPTAYHCLPGPKLGRSRPMLEPTLNSLRAPL